MVFLFLDIHKVICYICNAGRCSTSVKSSGFESRSPPLHYKTKEVSMREIKFRVWDVGAKKWVKYLTYCIDDFSTSKKDWHIVMQYTGLKDKNGKEIYEGDIVTGVTSIYSEYLDESFPLNFKSQVKFVRSAFCIEQKSSWAELPFSPEGDEFIEIIGNIYENPEMLG